ncbi:MAG: hypothetical protein WAX89_07265 [Alphaproteobacteria bacterium]
MRLKTITAPDMAAAIRVLKQELGSDAVILSTRKLTGPNGKLTLEITAGIDEPEPTFAPAMARHPQSGGARQPADSIQFYGKGNISAPKGNADANTLKTCEKIFAQHGLAPAHANLLEKALTGVAQAGFSPADALEMVLGKKVTFVAPAQLIGRGQVHVFVGPTGAGKTTLIGKLAVERRKSGATVGLLSLDDQKIGGFEPLRVVASALGEQARLIRGAADMPEAAASLGKRHYIFVDTAGLNLLQPAAITQFHQRLQSLGLPLAIHMVAPANWHGSNLGSLPYALRALQPASLLFTKLDETLHWGGLANVVLDNPLPCGLISASPAMEDGLIPLTPRLLAERLLTPPRSVWELTDEG